MKRKTPTNHKPQDWDTHTRSFPFVVYHTFHVSPTLLFHSHGTTWNKVQRISRTQGWGGGDALLLSSSSSQEKRLFVLLLLLTWHEEALLGESRLANNGRDHKKSIPLSQLLKNESPHLYKRRLDHGSILLAHECRCCYFWGLPSFFFFFFFFFSSSEEDGS